MSYIVSSHYYLRWHNPCLSGFHENAHSYTSMHFCIAMARISEIENRFSKMGWELHSSLSFVLGASLIFSLPFLDTLRT